MEPGELRAIDGREPLETQIAEACSEAITTVHDTLRSVQTAALDMRDAIVALERLHASMTTRAASSETVQALHSALEHGVALVNIFATIGLYDPIPIELL